MTITRQKKGELFLLIHINAVQKKAGIKSIDGDGQLWMLYQNVQFLILDITIHVPARKDAWPASSCT